MRCWFGLGLVAVVLCVVLLVGVCGFVGFAGGVFVFMFWLLLLDCVGVMGLLDCVVTFGLIDCGWLRV